MIYPDFNEVKRYTRRGNVVPVYRTILADTETPVSAYLKLSEGEEYSFLLESVEGGEKIARYSFLGADPQLVFRSKGKRGSIEDRRSGKVTEFNGDPIDELRSLIEKIIVLDDVDLVDLSSSAIAEAIENLSLVREPDGN